MAINNSCSSAQTFCAIKSQVVKDYNELLFNYTPSSFKDENITAEIWNQIIDAIINIYNYGTRGTRNPVNPLGITNFTSPADTHVGNETKDSGKVSSNTKQTKYQILDNIIPLDEYNDILNSINLTQLTDINNLITEEAFNSIKNKINNYKLDASRCNNCNTGCNVACQVSSQCHCDCDCDSGWKIPGSCEGTHGCNTYCVNFM